jgi:hypothetical protein
MVLFNKVVQVLQGLDICFLRQQVIGLHLTHRSERGSLPIKCDRLRWRVLMLDGLAEKGFSRSHVSLWSDDEVHRPAGPIYRRYR